MIFEISIAYRGEDLGEDWSLSEIELSRMPTLTSSKELTCSRLSEATSRMLEGDRSKLWLDVVSRTGLGATRTGVESVLKGICECKVEDEGRLRELVRTRALFVSVDFVAHTVGSDRPPIGRQFTSLRL